MRRKPVSRTDAKRAAAGDPDVDDYVSRAGTWQGEIRKLRAILLGCGLDEALKWGKPCYGVGGKNVAIIQPFKGHCALLFFKGALLEDVHGLLRSQGKNTQAALRLEFRRPAEVKKDLVAAYVEQAIALETSGRRVDFKAKRELVLPDELKDLFEEDRALENAFEALTPGRQRGYVLHFTGAKKTETRRSRILACRTRILAGLGMHDRL